MSFCGNACGWLRHFFFNYTIEDGPGNGALIRQFSDTSYSD